MVVVEAIVFIPNLLHQKDSLSLIEIEHPLQLYQQRECKLGSVN